MVTSADEEVDTSALLWEMQRELESYRWRRVDNQLGVEIDQVLEKWRQKLDLIFPGIQFYRSFQGNSLLVKGYFQPSGVKGDLGDGAGLYKSETILKMELALAESDRILAHWKS